MKILFCNIAWMKYYKEKCIDDIPKHGGSFVALHQDANESSNFHPIVIQDSEGFDQNVKYCFGSFETKNTSGSKVNQTHIEKISGCELMVTEPSVDGVLVIWCARSNRNESVVVGWYRNARVYREYQKLNLFYEEVDFPHRWYNVAAKASDCVLLPEGERNRFIWAAARARKKGRSYGFGQANVWYAREASATQYIQNLVENIDRYEGDNWINQYPSG